MSEFLFLLSNIISLARLSSTVLCADIKFFFIFQSFFRRTHRNSGHRHHHCHHYHHRYEYRFDGHSFVLAQVCITILGTDSGVVVMRI